MFLVGAHFPKFYAIIGFILEALEAENEGIRTHAIKFIEVLVLCQSMHPSPPEDGSEVII